MSAYTPTTGEVRGEYASKLVAEGEPVNGDAVTIGEAIAIFNRWLSRHDAETAAKALEDAAQIADAYAGETRTYRDNETDYPESWFGMQVHGQAHGAQDAAIRIRARAAAIRTQQEGTK